MTGSEAVAGTTRLQHRLRAAVWVPSTGRVRPTWRVLLALPVLWVVTGGVLAGNVQSAVDAIPSGGEPLSGLAQSVLHAGFVLVILAGWARYFDRRPLSSYGISHDRGWVATFLVGFLAVAIGIVFWRMVGLIVGTTSLALSPSVPGESVVYGLVAPAVALFLHAVVQQIVFFGVVLLAAAEGASGRGADRRTAAAAALAASVTLFVLMHGEMTALRAVDLAVAGGIFALLALHTGDLAVGIGAHFGSLFAGTLLSAVVETTGSLSGVLGDFTRYGFPTMVVAYLLVVAWLRWRRGTVGVDARVVRGAGE